jgi:Protein of unknown function (DUF3027)
MNPEPEQAKPQAEPAPSKKRAGVPVWRTGKPDAVLAAAVDVARTAIEGIAKASEVGEHMAARTEGDRLVTHLFESKLPGYVGWQWYAVLTRNSRSKVVTVSELGLLPSEDSVLAPEWVPWAERVRPEDAQAEDAQSEDLQEDAPAEAEPRPAEGGPAGSAGRGGESDGGPATLAAEPHPEPAEEYDGTPADGTPADDTQGEGTPADDDQDGSVQGGDSHRGDVAEADNPRQG